MPLGHEYRVKCQWEKLTKQIRAQEDLNRRNRASAQAWVSFFQDKIRQVLDENGVFSDIRHMYMAYAHALDKSQKDLAFMVDLIRQHQILRDRFQRRGLDPAVLGAIDTRVIYRTADY